MNAPEYLSAILLVAALLTYGWGRAPIVSRSAASRRSAEHWTERRARQMKLRIARLAGIYLGIAALALEGVAQLVALS